LRDPDHIASLTHEHAKQALKPVKIPPDAPANKGELDFLKHIPDCAFKRYAQDVAAFSQIPETTVFMTGLSLFGAVASRVYAVTYPNGERLPLGQIVAAGSPPGVGKSKVIKSFSSPTYPIYEAAIEKVKQRNQEEEEQAKADKRKPEYKKAPTPIYMTDATPESIDASLEANYGFFGLASAEQAVVNTVLGASYGDGKKHNNDLLLKGFNGEYHASSRASRGGFIGEVVGSITCYSQTDAIETLLEHSNGTGLAERALLLLEPDRLGMRDHTLQHVINPQDRAFYELIVKDLAESALLHPKLFGELEVFKLDESDWYKIIRLKQDIEPHLAKGGKYGTATLRGTAGKVDMQIMKIATLLTVADGTRPDHFNGFVPSKWVDAAINLMTAYLDYLHRLLIELGVVGLNAYEDSVIGYLSSKNGKATRRQFQQAAHKSKPWSELPKDRKSAIMNETINGLITKGVLSESSTYDLKGVAVKQLTIIS
jgi:hypothetical protein